MKAQTARICLHRSDSEALLCVAGSLDEDLLYGHFQQIKALRVVISYSKVVSMYKTPYGTKMKHVEEQF